MKDQDAFVVSAVLTVAGEKFPAKDFSPEAYSGLPEPARTQKVMGMFEEAIELMKAQAEKDLGGRKTTKDDIIKACVAVMSETIAKAGVDPSAFGGPKRGIKTPIEEVPAVLVMASNTLPPHLAAKYKITEYNGGTNAENKKNAFRLFEEAIVDLTLVHLQKTGKSITREAVIESCKASIRQSFEAEGHADLLAKPKPNFKPGAN